MITFFKIVQILINILFIIEMLIIGVFIDIQSLFGIAILINTCISIAIIFDNRARKKDRIVSIFSTFVIFLIAQLYTAISAMIISKDIFDYLYKSGAFCINAIMMGVALNAYKKYNE